MAMRHMVLCKKIDELEAEANSITHHPIDMSYREFMDGDDIGRRTSRVHRKINFVKTLLAAETESHSQDDQEHLGHMANRLSAVEKNMVEWATIAATDGHIDGPASPCSCTSSCMDENGEEHEQEEEDTEECDTEAIGYPETAKVSVAGDSKAIVPVVIEKIRCQDLGSDTIISSNAQEMIKQELNNILSETKFKEMIVTLTKKVETRKRRSGCWLQMLGTAAVAAVAIGFAIASFGMDAEPGYLVPT